MQTQTSNTLHNAIVEAGGKVRPPMLVPGNYVQWKSRIKRYIDTKANHELIHYCLKNPPYKYQLETRMFQLLKVVLKQQLKGIDNDIYPIVDACPNACEMWKAIERLKQGESINVQDLGTNLYWEFGKFTSRDVLTSTTTRMAKNDDDDDLANERDLLASLIEKLKCEINDNKNRNKFLETSNKVLVDKLKGEIEDFKTKNKILESSNNHFKEAKNELSKTNELMYKDLKKFQAELARYNDVQYVSKMEIYCVKVKGDLLSYKMEFEKSSNVYTQKINDLNQTILDMKKELFAHQETTSILSQQKKAQLKFYKTREDKEIDKVIALENKVKVLDNIIYKTGQSVQTMNMLNRNCKTSFAKPEFLKKAQREKPRMYDIGCYNDNLALMLAPETDEVIHLEKESRSKLSVLIRSFDYEKLNNLYDLFVPQREKSINADLEKFHLCLKEEMVADLRYFNSFELEIDSLKSQLETQKTQFLNEIDPLSREYYYDDHMNAILGVYTELDEVTNLQFDYLETLEKCECLEQELSKSKMMSKSFEALQKHAINLELDLQQCQENIKNDKSFKENQSKEFCKERDQYFEIQDLKAQLQDKGIAICELKKLIEKLKGKYVETKFVKSLVIRQLNALKVKDHQF
nr:hypothetical protein [Tanacetum cinerariifolium]